MESEQEFSSERAVTRWFKPLGLAALVSFLLLPICIFVHELGHFSVAKAYGWRTNLLPAQVNYRASPAPGEIPRIVFLIAGPVVDFALVATGILILLGLPDRDENTNKLIYWAAMALAFVSLKWILTPLIAVYSRTNDEAQISELLGWHPMVLPFMAMTLGIPIVIYVVRQHLEQGTWVQLLAVPVFGFLGAVAWIQFVGPMVLN